MTQSIPVMAVATIDEEDGGFAVNLKITGFQTYAQANSFDHFLMDKLGLTPTRQQ